MKVTININGVTHEMYRPRSRKPCYECSIQKECSNTIGCPCTNRTMFRILNKTRAEPK